MEDSLMFYDYVLFLGIDIMLYLGLNINQRNRVTQEFFYQQRNLVIKQDPKDFVMDLLTKARYTIKN